MSRSTTSMNPPSRSASTGPADQIRSSLASQKYAQGAREHPWGIAAGLLAGWTLLPLALWGAVLGGILGFLIGVVDALRAINTAHQYGISEGVGWLSIVGHTTGGIVLGFWAIYGGSIAAAPGHFLIALMWGGIAALLITFGSWSLASWILTLQGARRLSHREADVVLPAYHGVASNMGITNLPPVMILDRHPAAPPQAWTHLRTIVLMPSIVSWLRAGDERGNAILAHELEHYREGHVFGLRLVWAAAFPVVMAHSLAIWLANHRVAKGGTVVADFLSGIAYFMFWPAVVLMRFFVNPISTNESRDHEYACDRAAVAAGYGDGMYAALETLAGTSPGAGSGWDKIVLATHPPIELRIERVLEQIGEPSRPSADPVSGDGVPEDEDIPERISAAVAPRRRRQSAGTTAGRDGQSDLESQAGKPASKAGTRRMRASADPAPPSVSAEDLARRKALLSRDRVRVDPLGTGE